MIKSIIEFWTTNSASILSILVVVHLITEYFHYAWEFFTGRKEKHILSDILNHRQMSTKTAKLCNIQSDITLIKKHLGIEEK